MMPWKLLAFILAITIVLVFIGFNLENRCDVSLAFYTFSDVPVVITILASFLLGLLMAFPLSFVRKPGKYPTRGKRAAGLQRVSLPDEQGPSFGASAPAGSSSSASKKTRHKANPAEDRADED